MAFDEEFARDFASDEDRDAAGELFVGRKREIEGFARTLRRAGTRPQAAFRVVQGAPGAGKSALLHRLGELHADEALFVRLSNDHLADRNALAERIARTAVERASFAGKTLDVGLQGLGGFLRMGAAADRLAEYLSKAKVERVALCLDEAQTVDESCAPGLRELHANGIGRPTVVVLVGLSYTADRARSLGGLSRLSEEAVVDLGALAQDECAESTAVLLDAVGAEGDRDGAARFVARLSLGWPQHLKAAQKRLCRELLRTDGDLDRADAGRVRRETDEARHAYYEGRLAGSALGEDVGFTAGIVAAARRKKGISFSGLSSLCIEGLPEVRKREPGFPDISGRDFARLLVEKGVLSRVAGGGFEASIPSMADWLDARGRPRDNPRGGLCR